MLPPGQCYRHEPLPGRQSSRALVAGVYRWRMGKIMMRGARKIGKVEKTMGKMRKTLGGISFGTEATKDSRRAELYEATGQLKITTDRTTLPTTGYPCHPSPHEYLKMRARNHCEASWEKITRATSPSARSTSASRTSPSSRASSRRKEPRSKGRVRRGVTNRCC